MIESSALPHVTHVKTIITKECVLVSANNFDEEREEDKLK